MALRSSSQSVHFLRSLNAAPGRYPRSRTTTVWPSLLAAAMGARCVVAAVEGAAGGMPMTAAISTCLLQQRTERKMGLKASPWQPTSLLASSAASVAVAGGTVAGGTAAESGQGAVGRGSRLRLRGRRGAHVKSRVKSPPVSAAAEHGVYKDAEWFGAFSDGESTYEEDRDADKDGSHLGADDSSQMVSLQGEEGRPPEWFQESLSGGPKQAWQTIFPAIEPDHPYSSDNQQLLPSMEYDYSDYGARNFKKYVHDSSKEADWFDNSVGQFDTFGRWRMPSEASDRRYLDWEYRTRTVPITCADPGCTGSAVLQIFDPAKEMHHNCRLSVGVHATDFDDDFSKEVVEFISVNGDRVNSACNPMASGCNETKPASERLMYPCVNEIELGHTLLESGTVNITGKLSDMVDECPVDGNLLSAVAKVTCFVRDISDTVVAVVAQADASAMAGMNGSALLQCRQPNCTAQGTVLLGAVANKICKLTVKVYQTDFDSDSEQVDFIQADGLQLQADVKPGRNPCKEIPLGANNMMDPFVAVDGYDVSAQAFDGKVVVTAKISQMVDECGRDGNLLDAIAEVVCT